MAEEVDGHDGLLVPISDDAVAEANSLPMGQTVHANDIHGRGAHTENPSHRHNQPGLISCLFVPYWA